MTANTVAPTATSESNAPIQSSCGRSASTEGHDGKDADKRYGGEGHVECKERLPREELE